MDKIRWAFQFDERLTAEEAKAIVPNVGDEVEGDAERSKKDKEDFIPPRVVTEKSFPITKAGIEKFFEINEEVDKRAQDINGMYIYNDFSGYGIIEVLENTVGQCPPYPKSGFLNITERYRLK